MCRRHLPYLLFCLFIALFSCAGRRYSPPGDPRSVSALRFRGIYEMPHWTTFEGTKVGGLSGIEYDEERDFYYLICDDRSALHPARFYRAKISLAKDGIDSVWIIGVDTLKQSNGRSYPPLGGGGPQTVDPEAIRLNHKTGQLVWSSEGERIVTPSDTLLIPPSINIMDLRGQWQDSLQLPANLYMQARERGPRRNGILESLALDADCRYVYTAVEEPLYEDGPPADTMALPAYVRFFKFDMRSRRNIAQYAYLLDPVAHAANPLDAYRMNGIPDILAVNAHQFLVTERSYSKGHPGNTVKVFLADLRGAEDIRDNPSLIEQPTVRPIAKTLLLNMDDLGVYIDNVEGATFGPSLANGHCSLLFVTDENYNLDEKTQFLLFEVIP